MNSIIIQHTVVVGREILANKKLKKKTALVIGKISLK